MQFRYFWTCRVLNFSKAMSGVTERTWMSTSTLKTLPLEEIHSLAASGASMDDVTDKIQQKTRLNTNLIKFIAKNKITA